MISYIYFIKVIVCSLVLLGYYFIALRNKVYHQYNRIYLLFSIIASWIIPTLSFSFLIEQHAVSSPIYSVIDYASQHSNITELNNSQILVNTKPSIISIKTILSILLYIISFNFLLALLASFFKIYLLKKKYKAHKLDNYTIYLTNEKYTPYSFLNVIFWNQNIDLDSKLGKQILQHELVHIREKHSLDKIFIQANLIVGWFNPFFWLIKAELEMIHEFIADGKSIPNADVSEFANMILSVNQVNKHLPLTNPFFFSPIKRRLQMLTQKKASRFSYLQRVFALPVFVFLVLLLSLKSKQTFAQIQKLFPTTTAKKEATVYTKIKPQNNTETINKRDDNINTTAIETNLTKAKDSTEVSIADLQKQYQAIELQYKKETAIAKERKKLIELIQKQDLPEEQIVQVFKILVNADATITDKTTQKQLQKELISLIGNEKFKELWKEKTQLNKETEAFLTN